MADNAPNPTELQAQLDRLTALAGSVRTALGLGDDADDAAILAALGNTTKERDEAKSRADTIAAERDGERMDAEIRHALGKSGIIAQNTDDAAAILRGVLEVKEGRVVTKAVPNVVPGQTVEQFIVGQLRSLRPHYWPASAGAGAKGGGPIPSAGADVSCFKPGGTLTDQMAVVARMGERAVIDSLRRAGIVPPAWLTKGGGR